MIGLGIKYVASLLISTDYKLYVHDIIRTIWHLTTLKEIKKQRW